MRARMRAGDTADILTCSFILLTKLKGRLLLSLRFAFELRYNLLQDNVIRAMPFAIIVRDVCNPRSCVSSIRVKSQEHLVRGSYLVSISRTY